MIKKILLFSFFCFVLFSEFVFAATLFEQANASYQSGDFKAAGEAYTKIIKKSQASAAVYYNLGNAQFRMGQKGQALISYERALRIRPRDPDILWNITVLKSTFLDRLDVSADPIFIFWIKKYSKLVSTQEVAAGFSAMLAALFLISFLSFLLPRWEKAFKTLSATVILAIFLSGALLAYKVWQETEPKAVILEKEIFARFGPSGKETKAFLLHEGAEGRITDEVKDWVHITLENKNSGWVPKKSCEII